MIPEPTLWAGARIGILGGTFDPPHLGHVAMAEAARDGLGLDRVLFSVAPRPPHKRADETRPYNHRVAMVQRLLAGRERLGLTRVEEGHSPSYTVDLLRASRSRTAADLYFIVGADSLAELKAWHDPGELLRLCTLVVFPRGPAILALPVPGPASLVVFEVPVVDVSSTAIRASAGAGEPLAEWVGPGVAAYIEQHGLYRVD